MIEMDGLCGERPRVQSHEVCAMDLGKTYSRG
jgi:hypothetical protein